MPIFNCDPCTMSAYRSGRHCTVPAGRRLGRASGGRSGPTEAESSIQPRLCRVYEYTVNIIFLVLKDPFMYHNRKLFPVEDVGRVGEVGHLLIYCQL